MNKCIVVKSNGTNRASGVITEKDNIKFADESDLNETIQNGITEVANILSGIGVGDPTKKRCSRCAKMGRMPYHPVTNFSTLKNGKLLSQCKVCRTEQSDKWCRQAPHRQEYQRLYQKARQPNQVTTVVNEQQPTNNLIKASEAFFVALPVTKVGV